MRLDRPLGPLGLVPSAATPAIILIYISTLSKLNPHVSTRNCVDVEKEIRVEEGHTARIQMRFSTKTSSQGA